MDGAVDAYFPLLDKLDEFVDSLEQRVIIDFDQSALAEIFAVKRLVLSLRRHVGPEREVFNILTNRPSQLLSPESQIYFRDIYDHVLRINDSIETYRDLLSSVLDSYLTQVSNRLGRITKGLSVIATLSIPVRGDQRHVGNEFRAHSPFGASACILVDARASDGDRRGPPAHPSVLEAALTALRLHAITVADAPYDPPTGDGTAKTTGPKLIPFRDLCAVVSEQKAFVLNETNAELVDQHRAHRRRDFQSVPLSCPRRSAWSFARPTSSSAGWSCITCR